MAADRKHPGVAFWTTVVVLALLAGYPLSLFPVAWTLGGSLGVICLALRLAGVNNLRIIAVVDNIRSTIALYRGGEPYEMPPEFHDRLRKQLRDKWQKAFGGPSQSG